MSKRYTLVVSLWVLVTGIAMTTTWAGEAPKDADPALRPLAFEPLPLGSIKPAGWLRDQLRLQADGLSGHLDEFWPDIKDSAWFGGKAEGWERVPYWLDGLVPLAYLLDDPALQAKVKKAIDFILDHQQPDGWLGPVGDRQKHKPYDVWPLFPLFKAFTQYQEATGDPRIIPALLKCCHKIDEVISKEPMYSWARFRVADLAVSLYWLHDRTKEPWLLDLAKKAFAQSHDWRAQFDDFRFTGEDSGASSSSTPTASTRAWRSSTAACDIGSPAIPGTRTPSSGCSSCWTVTTARRPASSPATSTWPAAARRRGPSSAPSSRRCTRSRSWRASWVMRDWATGSRSWPSTPCRRPSRRT